MALTALSQSSAQEVAVSLGSQVPLPQGGKVGAQSLAQVKTLSGSSHLPSPQTVLQSNGQLTGVSLPLHVPSPQIALDVVMQPPTSAQVSRLVA